MFCVCVTVTRTRDANVARVCVISRGTLPAPGQTCAVCVLRVYGDGGREQGTRVCVSSVGARCPHLVSAIAERPFQGLCSNVGTPLEHHALTPLLDDCWHALTPLSASVLTQC
eukprot:3607204-Prymnesium_polylepis.1